MRYAMAHSMPSGTRAFSSAPDADSRSVDEFFERLQCGNAHFLACLLYTSCAAALGFLVACGGKQPTAAGSAASPQATQTVNTMEIVDLQPGPGAAIAAGQTAVMQYTGWLYETSAPDKKGKEFDSSSKGGQPFRFVLGGGQVIKGWDQGLSLIHI